MPPERRRGPAPAPDAADRRGSSRSAPAPRAARASNAIDEVVRQRGERVGQRLAGMALGIEAELRLQLPPAARAAPARRAGGAASAALVHSPAWIDSPATVAALDHRHDDEVERHGAVDGRDQVRLEQQRRLAAAFEPARSRARAMPRRGSARRCALRAMPSASPAAAVDDASADGRAASDCRRGTIAAAPRPRPRGSVAHRRAPARAAARGQSATAARTSASTAREIVDQLAPLARVGALHLEIDHRFAAPGARRSPSSTPSASRRGADDRVDDRGRSRCRARRSRRRSNRPGTACRR